MKLTDQVTPVNTKTDMTVISY